MKHSISVFGAILIIYLLFVGQNASAQDLVFIGSQIWMASNLDVVTFRNGDSIPRATSREDWNNAIRNKKPAYSDWSDFKFYNWYAVNDSRGLAPEGWHIPSIDEWILLIEYLGGKVIDFKDYEPESYICSEWFINYGSLHNVGGKLKSLNKKWMSPNEGATNESGFSAQPHGYYDVHVDGLLYQRKRALFWSSSVCSEYSAHNIYLDHEYKEAFFDTESVNNALSVRCVMDD